MHDAGDALHVHTSGGDVGRDERAHLAAGERTKGAVALRLAAAAVDRDRGHTELVELLREPIGTVPGAAEHDRRPDRVDRVRCGSGALGPVDPPEDVAGGREVGALLADLVDDGIVLDLTGELGHCSIERGGEQQHLPLLARQLDDAPYCGQEPHVGHAVGLVDDDLVDVVELHETGLDQILEPAGAGHHQLGGGVEGFALGAVAHAAVHRHDVMAAEAHERP